MTFPPRLSVTLTTHLSYPSLFGRLTDVFHQWVSERVFDDILLDVADYRHVSKGPGLFVIGHEFNYQLRVSTNHWELSCHQKRDLNGRENPLRTTYKRAVLACALLEDSLGERRMFNSQAVNIATRDGLCKKMSPTGVEEFAWLTRQTLAPMIFTVPTVKLETARDYPSLKADWLAPRSLKEILAHSQDAAEPNTGSTTG